ncbi:glycosyl hydrolase family 8 [Chryseobacterium sp. SL1]|uniref:glycosyl hydrolase family 8 n=1 Tax=Chryseobacterium sp. SL1 TaxID=2995159 RepID=UPI002276F21C|nr:glycosyl hydrolase family 8 [Chryseobacterium sp. SL1]MCY1660230.1 glycosyl hydrolase family 8 [Chryseobacterium sp. SL1]
MEKKHYLQLFLTFITSICFAQTPAKPFPIHYPVTAGCIKPTNQTQAQMDNAVSSFYNAWKTAYLKPGCTSGEYYIEYINGTNICVSEGQGYGMVIVAYMAGFDPQAKTYFDGLYRWYKSHPSTINSNLMNWQQGTGCVSTGSDAATDGDLDIAYGLLLAHTQWGSSGIINYLSEATNIINAIKASERYVAQNTLLLGDWATSATAMDDTRPSDFMFDHFTSFKAFTNDATWDAVKTKCYDLTQLMQTNFSPVTGLLPDFIEDVDGTPHPAAANFLESAYDGAYYYNACRVPWHLGASYLINGDAQAKTACDKMNTWLKSHTGNNINNLQAGYKLDGSNITGSNYTDIVFLAPLAVSACVNNTNQTWLNDLWTYVIAQPVAGNDYFQNTVKMLCMLSITQNYFPPQISLLGVNENQMEKKGVKFYPNPVKDFLNLEIGNINYNAYNIYDLNGKLLKNENNINSNSSIDVRDLNTGIYYLQLFSESKEIQTIKFLK